MFLPRRVALVTALVLASVCGETSKILAAESAPLLLRHPSLSQTAIAFRYADDIWTVARSGGEAQRLTSSGQVNDGPFYSPDGSQIAYSTRLHGSSTIFVIPAGGGVPRRITWQPADSYPTG